MRVGVARSWAVALAILVVGGAGCASSGDQDPADPQDAAASDDSSGDLAEGGEETDDGAELATTDAPDEVPDLLDQIDDLDETTDTITTQDGDEVEVAAKVAATDQQRARGLMGVEQLPAGVGMLFVYEDERSGGFWMKDTLVPLDIAYVDGEGEIVSILAMEPCEAADDADCEVYEPDGEYQQALEAPQGFFEETGVAEGDTIETTGPAPVG